jgi:putative endonuclease
VAVVQQAKRQSDASQSPSRARGASGAFSPPQDPRRVLGRLGEDLAATHLQRRGIEILARNVRTRHGEIDLIARECRTLVIVEVKTRRARAKGRDGSTGPPADAALEAIDRRKQVRLRRLAAAWLAEAEARPRTSTIRFDAIAVIVDRENRLLRLDHLEGAW